MRRQEQMIPLLLDVDGVLLDWLEGFYDFCEEKYRIILPKEKRLPDIGAAQIAASEHKEALSRLFFEEGRWAELKAFPDAKNALWRLKEAGYRFTCISAAEGGTESLRLENLEKEFGQNMFENVFHTDFQSKKAFLSAYPKGTLWVEDRFENAVLGKKLGLKSVWLNRYKISKQTDIPTYASWEKLCADILAGKFE